MLGTIIGLIVIGFVAGFIARGRPGKQSMGTGATIVLGIYTAVQRRGVTAS